jgi:hypothetical protein
MPDLDQLIRDLRGAPPPRQAPQVTKSRRWAPVALAATALLAVGAGAAWMLADGPYVGLRGAEGTTDLDLRMVVERGGRTLRVSRDGTCNIGEQVFFRVAANPRTELTLWVEGPLGKEEIARTFASPEPTDLESGHGMVSFEFERPGWHTFVLAPAGEEDCTVTVCQELSLEVR